MMGKIAIVMAAATLALAGCQTTGTSRDRIVRAEPRCESWTAPIYFEANEAEVTPLGRQVIAEAAARAKGCTVKAVTVVGLADAAGAPAANLELSKRRAESVAAAIAAAGLPAADFGLAAAGQAGAVTPAGQVAPVRRRAEVTLVLEAPK